MTTAGELAKRVAAQGGAALLIDYGRNRSYAASLQAIKQHQFCGLLEQPGLADLSAHVDFSAIRWLHQFIRLVSRIELCSNTLMLCWSSVLLHRMDL